mmetsp:Transcript_23427/g.50741  ORF Transcript_23427/g.50741 Transcript_23427/m.50741 type:complete len:760 (+) Transcript_23427:181-2460(+)|eukprot:CAMPEP_0172313036 /NCGR_PEP_ID=MMETSP1058-20130122/19183_1 /TAXON_ID=83371 /ORGANISM="Detonula confervacea, Strain CCMP 353" /LENGTH=759 /DNA_ID=CAMNT_0013026621 /DNA_START=125 /DNA_END=2404 /DNA_ORIENTATION=-
MVRNLMGFAPSKKSVQLTWAGKTIFLGSFPHCEAEDKLARAKILTKKWRLTMSPKPTTEWVKQELEKRGVRVISKKGRKKRREDTVKDVVNGSDESDGEGETIAMVSACMGPSKKKATVRWEGAQVYLGTFAHDEAKEKSNAAKILAKEWRMREPKPTKIWVMQELELAGVRVVSERGHTKRSEDSDESTVNGSDDERFSDASDGEDSGCGTMNNNSGVAVGRMVNRDPASQPKIVSPNGANNSGAKRKKSPCGRVSFSRAAKKDSNEIHLSLYDSRYKEIIMKYADTLDIATASDRQIKDKKISHEANQAFNELKNVGERLLKPGPWGRGSNLWDGDDKFDKAALKKIVRDLRDIVLDRRHQACDYYSDSDWSSNEAPPQRIEKTTPAARGAKKSKNANKSKRKSTHAPNPYNIFIKEFHAQRKESGKQGSFVNNEPGASMKAAGAAWSKLSAEEKTEYERKAYEVGKESMAGDSDAEFSNSLSQTNDSVRDTPEKEVEEEEESNNNSEDHNGSGNVDHQEQQQQQQQQQPTQVQQGQNTASLGQAGIKLEEDSYPTPHPDGPGDPQEVIILGQSDAPQNDNSNEPAVEDPPAENLATPAAEDLQAENLANPAAEDLLQAENPANHATEAHQTDNPTNQAAGPSLNQTAGSSTLDTVGEEEVRPLYDAIKAKMAKKGRNERIFYDHLKSYVVKQSMQNDGRLLILEVNKIKSFMDRFESETKKLDDEENDYLDRCLSQSFIKGIISQSRKSLISHTEV